MADDKVKEKDFHKLLQAILQALQAILQALKDVKDKSNEHKKQTKLKFFVYILMAIVYTKSMIKDFGWMGVIAVIVTFLVIYLSKNSGKTKRDISNDVGNENDQVNETGIFTKGPIIFIILVVLGLSTC